MVSITQGILVKDEHDRVSLRADASEAVPNALGEIRWSEEAEKFQLNSRDSLGGEGKGQGVCLLLSGEIGSRKRVKLELGDFIAIGVGFLNDNVASSKTAKVAVDGLMTFKVTGLAQTPRKPVDKSEVARGASTRRTSDFQPFSTCQDKLKERFEKSIESQLPEKTSERKLPTNLRVRIGGVKSLNGMVLPLKVNSIDASGREGCELIPDVLVDEISRSSAELDRIEAQAETDETSLVLEVVKGPRGTVGMTLQIQTDGATIGSSKSNTFYVDSEFVSAFHLRIEKNKSGEFWLHDMSAGTWSGVLVKRENGAFDLECNDTVLIMNKLFQVRFAAHMSGVQECWKNMAVKICKQRKSLRYISSPYQDMYVLLKKQSEIVIGRDPSACDIVLKDYTMQQYCALIVHSDYRFYIMPMNSTQKKGVFRLLGRRSRSSTESDKVMRLTQNDMIPKQLQEGDVFKMGRSMFCVSQLRTEVTKQTRLANEDFLNTVSLNEDFAVLTQNELKGIAQASCVLSFSVGENILTQGELGFGLYFVKSGKVKVTQDNAINDRLQLTELKRGDCFGESGLLYNDPAMATCEATGSKQVTCYFIHYHTLRAAVTHSTLVRLWTVLEERQMTTYRFLLKQNPPFNELSSAKLSFLCLQRNVRWYGRGEELPQTDKSNIWVVVFGKVGPQHRKVFFPVDRSVEVKLRATSIVQVLYINKQMYDLVLKMQDKEVEDSLQNRDSFKEVLLPPSDNLAQRGISRGQSLFGRVSWSTKRHVSLQSTGKHRAAKGSLKGGPRGPLTRNKSSIGEGEEFSNLVNMTEVTKREDDIGTPVSPESKRQSICIDASLSESLLTQSDVDDDSDVASNASSSRSSLITTDFTKELQEKLEVLPFYLIIEAVAGPQRGAHYLIDKPITLLGSEEHRQTSAQQSIKLNDKTLSKLHSMIEYRNGYFYLQDMGSKNGTFVKLVDDREHRLEAGDVLGISEHEFQVFAQSVAAPSHGLDCCEIT